MTDDTTLAAQHKQTIRRQAHDHRNALADKDERSERILDALFDQAEFAAAETVLFYVDVRSEVRTRHALPAALELGKRVVVPYCVDGHLELFHLEQMGELELGTYGILEPKSGLRRLPGKCVDVEQIDLIVVPGVAFDADGGRTGHGKGYYDKLLEHARADTPLIALAFQCQIFPEIPMQPHDVFMDKVITEDTVYRGRGRGQGRGRNGQ